MTKQFASHGDIDDKVVSFEKLSDNAYAYTAEGDPNTGIIVGDDAVMVIDTQATTSASRTRPPSATPGADRPASSRTIAADLNVFRQRRGNSRQSLRQPGSKAQQQHAVRRDMVALLPC